MSRRSKGKEGGAGGDLKRLRADKFTSSPPSLSDGHKSDIPRSGAAAAAAEAAELCRQPSLDGKDVVQAQEKIRGWQQFHVDTMSFECSNAITEKLY